MGFNRRSPKASCDPVGPSLTASRAAEPGAKPALMPRGTRRRASSVADAAAFRWKLPKYRYVSSCTSRVGVAVRSIASEESVVAPGAQVSFRWKHEYPAESFGHTTNRTKEDLSVDVEKSVGLAKRGAIRNILSNTVVCRSDDPRIGQMTENCSFEESVTNAKPEKNAATRPDPPSTLRNLGFQCASPGLRDSPAEPTDQFQGLSELFNPQNWSHKFHVIYPSVS